jgi:hypothetical protein
MCIVLIGLLGDARRLVASALVRLIGRQREEKTMSFTKRSARGRVLRITGVRRLVRVSGAAEFLGLLR